MATFIMLGSFTDQGIRNVKDTTKRVETVKASWSSGVKSTGAAHEASLRAK